MQKGEYLEHLDREVDAFVAAADGHFGERVPSCPEWTVQDLATHVWGVINFWPHVVLHNVQDPNDIPPLRPEPSKADLLTSIRRDADQAIGLLRHTNWSAPLWNWSKNKTVSFVHRRLANEIAIHRWDAENAAGSPNDIPSELAQDGIDEFIDIFIGSGWTSFKKGKPFAGELMKIQQLDPKRDWTIRLEKRTASVADAVADPDLIVRGTPSDLILMFWRRTGTERVEVEGDVKLLERFLRYEEPPDDD